MSRIAFARQLTALHDAVVLLGEQVDTAVQQAVQSFVHEDLALARRVVAEDAGVNRMEHQILEDATTLLTLQAPVASDLRRILGVSRAVGYLERIGDHARDIANTTLRVAGAPPIKPADELQTMIDAVHTMLADCRRAVETDNADLARTVAAADDQVDIAYGALFREMLSQMVMDAITTPRATHTLFVGHALERIADYCANVAETVIYVLTGQSEDLN